MKNIYMCRICRGVFEEAYDLDNRGICWDCNKYLAAIKHGKSRKIRYIKQDEQMKKGGVL